MIIGIGWILNKLKMNRLPKYFEYLIYKYFLGEIKENRQNAHTLFQNFIYN